MNILILTGKFGMGHWSASQSLRQQLLRAFPGAEVEVLDFVAEAMPNASEAMYKCFNLLVTRGSGLFNLCPPTPAPCLRLCSWTNWRSLSLPGGPTR